MQTLIPPMNREPGRFKAFCKLAAWVDVATVLAMDPPLEGAYQERWNRQLDRNEMLVPCDFETVDRAEFEAHMAELHDRPMGWKPPLERGWDHGRTPTIKCRPARAPKGKPEGTSFKPSAKAITEDVWTCPTCDLVAEVRQLEGERWKAEHERGCSLAMAGAAS